MQGINHSCHAIKLSGLFVIIQLAVKGGALCVIEEFTRTLVDVAQEKFASDTEKYSEMIQEEYELIRPSRQEEVLSMSRHFKELLKTSGRCEDCSDWQLEAAEITGTDTARQLNVGNWRRVSGLHQNDDLFPHVTGGLRGRTITVASVDVRLDHSEHS